MAKQSSVVLGVFLLLLTSGIGVAQQPELVLIRNSDVQSLDPPTPAIEDLFDPGTGDLLGQAYPQPFAYASHAEDLVVPADGPLVFYVLNDPDQTLFMVADDDRLAIYSSDGACRSVDEAELATLINNNPSLNVQHQKAIELYGALQYPGGVLCEDVQGTLSVRSNAALYDAVPGQLDGDERLVSLLYLRDTFEVPRAYIVVMWEDMFDFFNLDGGFRYDRTDPGNSVFEALDANGQTSIPTAVSCLAAGVQYKACLVQNTIWREEAVAEADELMAEALLECLVEPLAILVGVLSPPFCVTTASDGFSAQVAVSQVEVVDCSAQIPPDVTCDPPTGASPECTTSVVCRIDAIDEAPYCDWGTGPCTSPGCGGPAICQGGLCNAPWEAEVCDDYDNDCDGTGPTPDGADESWFEVPCDGPDTDLCDEGVFECLGGAQSCSDTSGDNIDDCNGIDDDCDTVFDEDFVPESMTCGFGACLAAGTTVCTNGVVLDDCVPGDPSPEVCDDVDNDCNGVVDNGACDTCPSSWWPGDGSAADAVGDHHGTLVGGATFVPGVIGQAFSLDGVDDHVITANNPFSAAELAGGATLAAWFKTTSTSYDFIADDEGYIALFINLDSECPANRLVGVTDGGYQFFCSVSDVNDGEWHHAAIVWDSVSSTATLYLDGVPEDAGPSSAPNPDLKNRPLAIGTHSSLPSWQFLEGAVDEVALHDRALTRTEINTIVVEGHSGACGPSVLQQTATGFYWPTGSDEIGNYAAWLADSCAWSGNSDYFHDDYHIGWDLEAAIGSPVFAVSDGIVRNISFNGWGSGNVAAVIEHTREDGSPFIGVYGHIATSLEVANTVEAGQQIGTVGPWSNGDHLHFGVRPGNEYPAPYGLMDCPLQGPIVPPGDTNGFVDPLDWIQTEAPGTMIPDPGGSCPVSWWRAEGNADDEVGASHGTTSGGVAYVGGQIGSAFSFDGSSEVTIPDAPSLNVQQFTIDAWVYPTQVDGSHDIIVNKEGGIPGGVSYELGIRGTSSKPGCETPTGNLSVFIGGVVGLPASTCSSWVDAYLAVPLNAWSHVAMTFDGSTLTSYLNGQVGRIVEGISGTVTETTGPFRIGARSSAGNALNDFDGLIDEVGFYDRALSGSEILAIVNDGHECATVVNVSVPAPSDIFGAGHSIPPAPCGEEGGALPNGSCQRGGWAGRPTPQSTPPSAQVTGVEADEHAVRPLLLSDLVRFDQIGNDGVDQEHDERENHRVHGKLDCLHPDPLDGQR